MPRGKSSIGRHCLAGAVGVSWTSAVTPNQRDLPPSTALREYADRIESDLRGNILPFWAARAFDGAGAGPRIVGALTNDLQLDSGAERGQLLAARILWTFSAAYARYRDPTYATVAELAAGELDTWFWDRRHGGFRWSIHANGSPARDRKQIYGQAFGLYALAEYHAATQRPEALARALQLFELIEAHGRDPVLGGYWEAFAPDWSPITDVRLSEVDQNDPKSQNTHLHVMEAYARLLRCHPEPRLRASLAALLDVMVTHVVQPAGHLGLFFTRDWKPTSEKVSFGHDIEAAWLMNDAADAVGDATLRARVHAVTRRLAEITLARGVDVDGGVFNEGDPAGLTNTHKEWWPQTEAVIGFLDAYQHSGDARYLSAALRTWDFIDQRLIDRRHGEWFRGVTRAGALLDQELKISFWKCPYHNGRAGLEAPRRLRAIADPALAHP